MNRCLLACILLLLLLALGCDPDRSILDPGGVSADDAFGNGAGSADDDDSADDSEGAAADADGDGWPAADDCDDQDEQIHPNAEERCNDLDDDCDGSIDEGAGDDWFEDYDGDGYGVDASLQVTCDPGADLVSVGGDCDDDNPAVYPGNPDRVDGVDSDCDGALDWRVTIYVAVDDEGELCIDSSENILGDTGGWMHGNSYEIWLKSGLHAIGIKGWDTGQVITAAIAHVETSNGNQWVSDASWRYDPNPTASEKNRVGWCAPYFDDSSWDLVQDIGPIGTSPWGGSPSSFPADSPAHWIWDHYPVNLNTQYLRKEFELP